jgi:glycosyltransferase involved in cell wall biosynthesis
MTAEERAQLSVRLVGSVFEGADHFAETIRATIDRHNLHDTVRICDFDPVPDAHYQWAEMVVVPSIKPEPFGLVAIEAMSSGRGVIAADHGGLKEIVVDGETGTRFTPGDPQALADAIRRYLRDRTLGPRHGAGSRRRYETEFREETHMRHIADAAARALSEGKPARVKHRLA